MLRFPASSVRPQGRTAAGMAGVKLAEGDEVIAFGRIDPGVPSVVVTLSQPDDALPGLAQPTVKISDAEEFPVKGRATAGVRAHRFLKGEDGLALGRIGAAPALASSKAGVHRVLPGDFGRRDGSGIPVQSAVDVLGGTLALPAAPTAEIPAEASSD